jgi:hypothetical protein
MYKTNDVEVERCIQDLDPSSAGSYDNITGRIIKIIVFTSWKEERNKTDTDIREEQKDVLFSDCIQNRMYELGIHTKLPSEWIKTDNIKTVEIRPFRAKRLIKMIVDLSLETRDIPTSEKLSIITGIPKKSSQVRSTNDIRPISVGPILGRIINKILATRLGNKLTEHGILDPAQHAFIQGKNIHEAINSLITCIRHHKSSQNDSCYLISYDISKAYDTINWKSIERALEMLGIDPNFIDMVMNSHLHSRLAMKTNIQGNVTPEVEMEKAIKQGCPLAPLLFIIVMDELHKGYRKFGGYSMGTHTVHSRGYCDDTAIISNSLEDLKAMNDWTCQFMETHNLQINNQKTVVTGRHKDGSPLREKIKWSNTGNFLTLIAPDEPTRYLGLIFTFDLDWSHQFKKMNGIVMNLVSRMRHKNISIYQASILIKHMLGPMLDIGMRHAQISHEDTHKWDTYLINGLTAGAQLQGGSVSHASYWPILDTLCLTDLLDTAKATQIMENLTKVSELQHYYRDHWIPTEKEMTSTIDQVIKNNRSLTTIRDDEKDSHYTSLAKQLARRGLLISHNRKSERVETVVAPNTDLKDYYNTFQLTCEGHTVTAIDTYTAWRTTNPSPDKPNNIVNICTDGSTYKGLNSGASLMFMEDDYMEREIWQTKGYYWTLHTSDNYIAELSAINKALRSIPIDQGTRIWTDSKSAMDAINSYDKNVHNLLRCQGRPYLIAIGKILKIRSEANTYTRISHVRSHTGFRNMQSIGNEEADRWAKYQALQNEAAVRDLDLLANELPFILNVIQTGGDTSPIHGDTRKDITKLFKEGYQTAWKNCISKGYMIREHTQQTQALIKHTWRKPDTQSIKFLLQTLNKAHEKYKDDQNKWVTKTCQRCTRGVQETTFHRQVSCPAVAALWNACDSLNHDVMGFLGTGKGNAPISIQAEKVHDRLKHTRQYLRSVSQASSTYKIHKGLTTQLIPHKHTLHLIRQITELNWKTQSPDEEHNEPPSSWNLTPSQKLMIKSKYLTIAEIRDTTTQVLSHLPSIHRREEWKTCKKLFKIVLKHLHTEKVINTDPLDPSHTGKLTSNMGNSFTWVNFTDENTSRSYTEQAMEARKVSLEPTRIVSLSNYSLEQEYKNSEERENCYTLARIPPGAITLKNRCPLKSDCLKGTNEMELFITVIENRQARNRAYESKALEKDLRDLNVDISLLSGHNTPDTTLDTFTWTLDIRNTQDHLPSLFWYRDSPYRLKGCTLSNNETLAGSLGLYRNHKITTELLKLDHVRAELMPNKLEAIQDNIRNTALSAFRLYENWKNRKKGIT